MNPFQQQLQADFPELPFQFDYLLANQTYFRIGGPAEVYLELSGREQIVSLVNYCNKKQLDLTILAGGSNVIVADRGIKGVVLKITSNDFERVNDTTIRAEVGLQMALLVRKTIDEGFTGLEFFLGVPGQLGGAVYNNAHYLEDLISEHISRVEIINEAGETQWLTKEECHFDYDYSRFQETDEIILAVEFTLPRGNLEKSQARIRKATEYRAKTQPLGTPSSGCIFQNTPNTPELKKLFPQYADKEYVPGGFLIDQAGLKGAHEGDIEVSDKHAAFFINTGQGTAADIQKLVKRVKSAVEEKFGVKLQEEVFWLGHK